MKVAIALISSRHMPINLTHTSLTSPTCQSLTASPHRSTLLPLPSVLFSPRLSAAICVSSLLASGAASGLCVYFSCVSGQTVRTKMRQQSGSSQVRVREWTWTREESGQSSCVQMNTHTLTHSEANAHILLTLTHTFHTLSLCSAVLACHRLCSSRAGLTSSGCLPSASCPPLPPRFSLFGHFVFSCQRRQERSGRDSR